MSNDFLRILGVNQTVFLSMIICGAFLIVTASVGVAAAYSKNDCLAFFVSHAVLTFIVWLPGHVHYVNLYRPLDRPAHLKVDFVLRANKELHAESRALLPDRYGV